MIDTIIFDCEGVIIDTHPLWEMADVEFLARRKISTDINKVHEKIVGTNLLVGATIMQETFHFPGDPIVLAEERFEIIKELFAKEIKFIPGFVDFFNSIKKHYKFGVATAIRKELMSTVNEKLDLPNLFGQHIYYITDVGNLSKPNPAIFLHTAKMLNSAPENCIVIEDAPNGIAGAKNAGMKSIGITTTFSKDKLHEATQIVTRFSEIDLSKF